MAPAILRNVRKKHFFIALNVQHLWWIQRTHEGSINKTPQLLDRNRHYFCGSAWQKKNHRPLQKVQNYSTNSLQKGMPTKACFAERKIFWPMPDFEQIISNQNIPKIDCYEILGGPRSDLIKFLLEGEECVQNIILWNTRQQDKFWFKNEDDKYNTKSIILAPCSCVVGSNRKKFSSL